MLIRILFLHGISEIGGSETDLLNILGSLDRTRFFPVAVCGKQGPLVEKLNKLQVDTHLVSLPPWRKLLYFWKIPISIYHLIVLIRSYRIDIVHVNDYWWGPVALLAARLCKARCVVHVRQQIESKRVRQYRLKFFDQVIAVSESIRNVGINSGIDYNRIQLIYSGIDCSRTSQSLGSGFREKYQSKAGQPIIGTIANLFPRKGLEHLLEAINLVKKTETDVHCIIVGEGDPVYRKKLHRLIEEKNLDGNVSMVGFQNDVYPFLQLFDIFVLPSILEGFGIVLLEAMAMSKPIVASSVGGTPESVDEGITGLLVSPENPRELSLALHDLIRDPEKRKRMGIAGRKRVEKHFNLSQTIEKLEKVYLNIVEP